MKKYIASLLVCIPLLAVAEDKATVTLGGTLNSQIGYRQQSKFFRTDHLDGAKAWNPAIMGGKLNNHFIVNDTKITIAFDAEYNNLKYGGKIKLNADTSEAKNGNDKIADKVLTYVEGNFGRIELANSGGATDAMDISAVGIARATGGIDGDAQYYYNSLTSDGYRVGDVFVAAPYLPFGCDCSSRIGKVTYYTPDVFNGFKLGVSYAPDSQVKGTIAQARDIVKNSSAGYRNLVEVALNYKYSVNDVDFGLAVLYQNAEAKRDINNIKQYKDINAWGVGGNITYKGFSIAGAYGDWGRSGTKRVRTPGMKYGANMWNAGIAYEQDAFGISATYFQSKRAGSQAFTKNGEELKGLQTSEFVKETSKHNKLEMLSVGMDYKVAPGLMPYAEVNYFKHDRAGTNIDNKGYIYLIGTKLSF